VGTVIADDPLLTDRSGGSRRRPLLRVILDTHLRLPLESRPVQSVTKSVTRGASFGSDVLVFCSSPDERRKRELEARGIRVESVPTTGEGRPDLAAILRRLGQLEITSVMIEGGSEVNATALALDLVDKVFFYYAPKIMASRESIPLASDFGLGLSEGLQVKHIQLHHFGEDFAVEGYLRDPYEE